MQNWFSGGANEAPQKASSSLLADWNSYAAARTTEESSGGGGSLVGVFDIESAVRSANDTVSGTFNVVSKGVRDIPGLQSATSYIPSGKSLMYFGIFLATGVFFVFISFSVFLPVIALVPQKFSICFTIGCAFIIGSFFALKGAKNQFDFMTSKERLPFTVVALAYYAISYFPGGSAGMKFLFSSLTSTVIKCFGR